MIKIEITIKDKVYTREVGILEFNAIKTTHTALATYIASIIEEMSLVNKYPHARSLTGSISMGNRRYTFSSIELDDEQPDDKPTRWGPST